MKTFNPQHAAENGYTREDWDIVSDNPEWTVADFASARPGSEVFPEFTRAMIAKQRARGAQIAPLKVPVALRLDSDLVEKLRASGKGWQSRANAMLRKAAGL